MNMKMVINLVIFFNFYENGEMFAEKRNYITNEIEEREGIVDVSSNWENIPQLGDYSNVMIKER